MTMPAMLVRFAINFNFQPFFNSIRVYAPCPLVLVISLVQQRVAESSLCQDTELISLAITPPCLMLLHKQATFCLQPSDFRGTKMDKNMVAAQMRLYDEITAHIMLLAYKAHDHKFHFPTHQQVMAFWAS